MIGFEIYIVQLLWNCLALIAISGSAFPSDTSLYSDTWPGWSFCSNTLWPTAQSRQRKFCNSCYEAVAKPATQMHWLPVCPSGSSFSGFYCFLPARVLKHPMHVRNKHLHPCIFRKETGKAQRCWSKAGILQWYRMIFVCWWKYGQNGNDHPSKRKPSLQKRCKVWYFPAFSNLRKRCDDL